MDKIKLWRTDDPKVFTEGDYADDANGASWILTRYSDTLCSRDCQDDHCYEIHPEECESCGEYILDMDHFVCMDGGESAHDNGECVTIHSTYPHQDGTLYDCPACDLGDE